MTDRPASNTAVGVAMLRAVHQLLDGLPRVLDDTVVVRLLGPDTEWSVRERAAQMLGPRATALRTHVLLRSRYAEERLQLATSRGVGQFVILGAGLDTFAYRQPEWSKSLRIYEVDHPASQISKRERLEAANIRLPENLVFVPTDFERETLRYRLGVAGLDFSGATFISCLGVIVYLTKGAVKDLFHFIASLAPGSECVFTFGGNSRQTEAGFPSLADLAAAAGEPFRSPLDVAAVGAVCTDAGLPEPIFPTAEEIKSYLGERQDWLRPPARASIASVTVALRV
ncbi:MAG: class I SAM-dependent methyltransferase [Gemmatimonadaceae bacterium]